MMPKITGHPLKNLTYCRPLPCFGRPLPAFTLDLVANNSIAITGGRVVPIEGDPIDGGIVLVSGGVIEAVLGPDAAVPPGVRVIDAAGKWVLPGLIDAHTHLGAYEDGMGWAGSDTNELTGPNQAQVRVVDAINPADIGFRDAIAGGVLAVNVNPGSGNPIGGQTAAVRCWGRTVEDMVRRWVGAGPRRAE
jgi:imidazolonepropionase-like amidohydrolase